MSRRTPGTPGKIVAALTTALLWLSCVLHSQAVGRQELEVVGLSVYRETGRDIFLASLLLPPGRPLVNLDLAPPPKAMEYRIASRRLSVRGFSGMVLLQAELGAGQRAPEDVAAALTVVKRNLKGSLKHGDHFLIFLNEREETVFILNDIEVHRIPDSDIFDFFFTGWVGEAAAATFREPLLSGEPDKKLLALRENLTPGEERVAMVRSWLATPPGASTGRVSAVPTGRLATGRPGPALPGPPPETAGAAEEPTVLASETGTTGGEGAASLQSAGVYDETLSTGERTPSAQAAERQQVTARTSKNPQVSAGVTPAPEPVPTASVDVDESAPGPEPAPVRDVAAAFPLKSTLKMDDREYKRELQEYIHRVMRQVYGEVKYPKRAIKYQWEGRVELTARLNESGDLLEIRIDSSSGHAGLDKAAEAAVKRAAPFPELTPVAREELASEEGDGYVMSIPVTFALRS